VTNLAVNESPALFGVRRRDGQMPMDHLEGMVEGKRAWEKTLWVGVFKTQTTMACCEGRKNREPSGVNPPTKKKKKAL